jgi:hypothetical protein
VIVFAGDGAMQMNSLDATCAARQKLRELTPAVPTLALGHDRLVPRRTRTR